LPQDKAQNSLKFAIFWLFCTNIYILEYIYVTFLICLYDIVYLSCEHMKNNTSYQFAPSCPIGREQVDGNVARAIATVVCLLLAIDISLGFTMWIPLFLATDFFIRISAMKQWSPLRILTNFVLRFIGVPVKLQNAAPKIFAAQLGLLFSVLLVALYPWSPSGIQYSVAGAFALCAFLEASFGYCL